MIDLTLLDQCSSLDVLDTLDDLPAANGFKRVDYVTHLISLSFDAKKDNWFLFLDLTS